MPIDIKQAAAQVHGMSRGSNSDFAGLEFPDSADGTVDQRDRRAKLEARLKTSQSSFPTPLTRPSGNGWSGAAVAQEEAPIQQVEEYFSVTEPLYLVVGVAIGFAAAAYWFKSSPAAASAPIVVPRFR